MNRYGWLSISAEVLQIAGAVVRSSMLVPSGGAKMARGTCSSGASFERPSRLYRSFESSSGSKVGGGAHGAHLSSTDSGAPFSDAMAGDDCKLPAKKPEHVCRNNQKTHLHRRFRVPLETDAQTGRMLQCEQDAMRTECYLRIRSGARWVVAPVPSWSSLGTARRSW